jgi:acyl-[acyl-carrier-protein] desaturase
MANASHPETPARPLEQREVLRGMSAFVGEHLNHLLPVDRAWQPTDYLPDLSAEDWRDRLAAFREPAGALSDPVLVVLVADMITEEALPAYAVALNSIAEDASGVDPRPWPRWLRGWTAEENRHGDLLNAYLRLTGRVDMRAVEVTIHNLLNNGFSARTEDDLYGGIVYTSFQEGATRVSHSNVAKLAAEQGEQTLDRICRRIAGDEARHESFYTRMLGRILDDDPAGGLISMMNVFRRVIAMPGRLMTDGRDPQLFDHFSLVAQRLGVYTAYDYAQLVEQLMTTLKVHGRAASGKAARAQDYLCRHAETVRSKADQAMEAARTCKPVKFSWIFDRTA